MIDNLIDGKLIAKQVKDELKEKIDKLDKKPCLAVILIGENPASVSYVKGKEKACEEVGIISKPIHLSENITKEEVINIINNLNQDNDVHGILVQLPLPKHLNEQEIINHITPNKDVDGFTHLNAGMLANNHPNAFIPCTPLGIIELFKRYNIETQGKRIAILGRSNIVGKPLANLLSGKQYGNATVTICHTATKDIKTITKQSDIIVVATGMPQTLTGDMINEGTIIIDVGVNRIKSDITKSGYKLIGDCDFESCQPKAKLITPVPGGVGPMTIAMLLNNTVIAASRLGGLGL